MSSKMRQDLLAEPNPLDPESLFTCTLLIAFALQPSHDHQSARTVSSPRDPHLTTVITCVCIPRQRLNAAADSAVSAGSGTHAGAAATRSTLATDMGTACWAAAPARAPSAHVSALASPREVVAAVARAGCPRPWTGVEGGGPDPACGWGESGGGGTAGGRAGGQDVQAGA